MKKLLIACVLLLVSVGAIADDGCLSSGLLTSSGVVVSTARARLVSVLIITDGVNAATVTAYDNNAGAAGTVLFKGTVPGASMFGGGDAGTPILVQNGIYISISGTGASAIVYYR